MIRLTAIVPHLVSYSLVAVAFFVLGVWYQSGQTPVLPEPITRNIPNFGNYLNLPDYRPPVYKLVVVEKTKVVTRIDTIRVPIEIERVRLLANNGIRTTNKAVYVKYFDVEDNRYVIDEYALEKADFWQRLSVLVLTIPTDKQLPLYGGLTAVAGYKRLGITASALFTPTGSPILLTGLSYTIY